MRSKLSATITSVPPWIGRASGRSAFTRSASASERGVRTSTRGTVRFSHGFPTHAAAGGGAGGRACRPRDPRRPRLLGLHTRVARDQRRHRRRLHRGPRRLRRAPKRSTRPAATSSRASSMRTCISSPRSCSSTSSPGSCCRSERPPSSPIRTRSRMCSAPTASTGCSTSATAFRSTSGSWPPRACRPRTSSRRGAS